MTAPTERHTSEGFLVVFDEYKGAIVDVPTTCPDCGMNVEGYWDMHIVFHHPEKRRIHDPNADKKKSKRKKNR